MPISFEFLADRIARRCAEQPDHGLSGPLEEAMTAVLREQQILLCDQDLWLGLQKSAARKLEQFRLSKSWETAPIAAQE